MSKHFKTLILFIIAPLILGCDGFNMNNTVSLRSKDKDAEESDSRQIEPVGNEGISMNKESGVYMIPCKVNSIPLKFIFDTGAATVVISITEAEFMYKNGHLADSDILRESQYEVASGEIVTGMDIVLKKVEIGGTILENVKATVMNNTQAPLLLGQSALERLGRISFDYTTNRLYIGHQIKID